MTLRTHNLKKKLYALLSAASLLAILLPASVLADIAARELYSVGIYGYNDRKQEIKAKAVRVALERAEEEVYFEKARSSQSPEFLDRRQSPSFPLNEDSQETGIPPDTDIDYAGPGEQRQEKDRPKYLWEYGLEVSDITYKEPGVMKENGIMYGMVVSYAYHNNLHPANYSVNDNWMLKFETRYAYGQVDYVNSGTVNDIDDNIWEARALAGYDYSVSEAFSLTPYIGIGYRYLKDDLGGRVSSTGAHGYKRESNYLYSPIGLEIVKGLADKWSLGLTLEYDLFWQGRQKSYLSNVDSGYNDLANRQEKGYGFRGALRIIRRGEKMDFAIEPFIRYWNIEKSDNADWTYYGAVIGYGYEPTNNSVEFGSRFALSFF